MRALVTGANGFVGKSLCAVLLQEQWTLNTASRQPLGQKLASNNLVINALDQSVDWTPCLQNVDVVFHLAARVHVMHDAAADPLQEFLLINLEATLNLARQAAVNGVKRFVYVSSIKVNGEATTDSPFTADDLANPQDPYAISKWQAEQALIKLSADTGMEVVIVRPPLVYGPGVKANFYKLLQLVDKRLPLPLGSINNQRSLIYVGNLVDALINLASHPAAAGQTFLVSDMSPVSTPDLIRLIARALGRSALLIPFPICLMRALAKLCGKTTAVDRLAGSLLIDDTKMHQLIGWKPPYSMLEGLQATADWYHHHKNLRDSS